MKAKAQWWGWWGWIMSMAQWWPSLATTHFSCGMVRTKFDFAITIPRPGRAIKTLPCSDLVTTDHPLCWAHIPNLVSSKLEIAEIPPDTWLKLKECNEGGLWSHWYWAELQREGQNVPKSKPSRGWPPWKPFWRPSKGISKRNSREGGGKTYPDKGGLKLVSVGGLLVMFPPPPFCPSLWRSLVHAWHGGQAIRTQTFRRFESIR